MTTIVYDHKNRQIACDGRETAGNEIKSESEQKWFYQGANLYFYCGSIADIEAFLNAEKVRGEKIEPPVESAGFVVRDGFVYKFNYCDEHGYWEQKLKHEDTMGSGGVYALCALDFGKSAKEAVEYAMTRDSGTGGKVSVFDCEKMEFIDG